MKHTLKRALAALFSLLLILSAALALPLVMNQVMKGSLSTQVVFAQEEAPVEADISPTPMPRVTPIQAPATPLPSHEPEPEDGPAATPIPVPLLPHAQDSYPLIQSYDWRKNQNNTDTERGQARLKLFTDRNPAFPRFEQDAILDFYWLANTDDYLLVESNLSGSLVSQQIAKAIISNAENDPVFIPESDAFDSIINLPISGVILTKNNDYASFIATNEQNLTLSTLRSLSQEGLSNTISQADFYTARAQLCTQAQQLIQNNDDAARQSAALVKELKMDDKPWNLLIMRNEPYICARVWDYYLAGHHMRVMDVDTAKEYTITTDLISGKVVGIATAGIEPYLLIYQNLLSHAEQLEKDHDAYNISRDRASSAAASLGKSLSGIDFQNGEWHTRLREASVQHEPLKVLEWEVQFEPVDAEAQLLDPEGGEKRMAYQLSLDENYQLISWSASPIIESSDKHGLQIGEENFDAMLSTLMQAQYKDQPEIPSRVDTILGMREQHYSEILEKVQHIFPGAMFTYPGQLWINHLKFHDHSTATQISFFCPFLTPEGKTMSATALVDEGGKVHITNLSVDRANASPTPIPTDDENEAIQAAATLAKQLAGADLGDASRWSAHARAYLAGEEKALAWEVSFRPLDENSSPSDMHLSYTLRLSQDFQLISWFTETNALSISSNSTVFSNAAATETKLDSLISDETPGKAEIMKRLKTIVNNWERYAEETLEKLRSLIPQSTLRKIEHIKVENLNFQDDHRITQIVLDISFTLPDGRLLWVSSLVNEDGSIQITQIFDTNMDNDLIL